MTYALGLKHDIVNKNINHLGLLTGVTEELELVKHADDILQGKREGQKISLGQRVRAMVFNLLSFQNRTLYKTEHFLENTACDVVLGPGSCASYYNDDALGRALDAIHEYGPAKFYQSVIVKFMSKAKLGGNSIRLDSTSYSLQGQYENSEREGSPNRFRIAYGYSKDKRNDLKQAVLHLATTGDDDLPILAEPRSGNSSDKTEFRKIVEAFQKHIKLPNPPLYIFDSAGYNKRWLKDQSAVGAIFFPWLTRIPETISKAKTIINGIYDHNAWKELENGYRSLEFNQEYGGVQQLWILYYSPQRYQQESTTVLKKVEKERKECESSLRSLRNMEFTCRRDAERYTKNLLKKAKYHKMEDIKTITKFKYKTAGRPKKGETPISQVFQVTATLTQRKNKIDEALNSCGRFILGTNAFDIKVEQEPVIESPKVEILEQVLPDDQNKSCPILIEKPRALFFLEHYKSLQGTERSFRLSKNREFMMNRFFLKKESRIEALLVLIALAIFIYNYTQRVMTSAMQKSPAASSDLKSGTVYEIFWVFKDIAISFSASLGGVYLPPNLNAHQMAILRALGPRYLRIYGQAGPSRIEGGKLTINKAA
jgi:transposase